MTNDHPGLSTDNAYSVLGVRHDAHDADITSAYSALARVYHPDVAGDGGNARMSRINAAWDRVRTPRRRDAYDRELGIFPVHRAPRRSEPKGTSRATGADQPIGGRGVDGSPPQARRYRCRRTTSGRPSGSVLQFGRRIGWSIGEVARVDPGYLEWLEAHREGALYLDEIDEALVRAGFRSSRPTPDAPAAADEAPLPPRLIARGRQAAAAGTITARSTRTWWSFEPSEAIKGVCGTAASHARQSSYGSGARVVLPGRAVRPVEPRPHDELAVVEPRRLTSPVQDRVHLATK